MNQKGNILEEIDPEDTDQTESLKKVSNMTKKTRESFQLQVVNSPQYRHHTKVRDKRML